ncbi:adenylate/guanylate cyclase domain-containing protein [Tateyamaria pelophila]|uniref:adenylate/guanylate cyclase domain-containing protein n=1 Tax=Tateyamaria pelophila TaxID=328415 RepID=UPI001CBB8B94|nr:adenylate/guanylate cyclase domain-containing protein [Tateyamaria pelophila]
MFDAAPHIEWILKTGRMLTLQGLIDGLGARLLEDGVPLMRLRLSMRTTHPLTAALSVFWEARSAPLVQITAPHGLETRPAYTGSPMAEIARTRAPFRRRLDASLSAQDHVSLHELRDRGATDYYGLPFVFAMSSSGMCIFTSDGPAGFSEPQIKGFDAMAPVLAPVIEVHNNYQLATAIATSYLGARTGQRVLDGQITRGDIETIEAAVLISDIRGWTAINATRPARDALDLANRYFEVISDAVDKHDGEILKFLGDGVLALFPTDGTPEGRTKACQRAVAAARSARDISAQSDMGADFGIGIHFGEVLYGNVGARARIDFTVLGQAVNIAARIEALTGQLGHAVLISDAVAQTVNQPVSLVGTEPLKGLTEPMRVYTPASF